jgi:hypothetical protein
MGWTGDIEGFQNPATVTMNQDKYITANFSAFNTSIIITSLSDTCDGTIATYDYDGNYCLGWTIIGGLVSNVDIVHEDTDESFPDPTSNYYTSGQRYVYFTNQPPGTYCYRVNNTHYSGFSAPVCIIADYAYW